MDKYEDYVQVLVPPGETGFYCSPEDELALARAYNDAVAEIVRKHPSRFVGAAAYMPLHNIDAALKEIDRAIDELGFKGIYLETPVYEINDSDYNYNYETMKPLDSPEFIPIYENMARRKLPIWIHPVGQGGTPVYRGEERDKYGLYLTFGWPLESAMAMSRLVCSGILAKYPDLRFIIHHCGSGMVPMLANRIDCETDFFKALGMKSGQFGEGDPFDTKRPTDYFRMFYGDTALDGGMPGLMCGHAFFGAEHIMFGTDFPYDIEGGDKFIRTIIDAVNEMNVSEADKVKIFDGKAKRILGLSG